MKSTSVPFESSPCCPQHLGLARHHIDQYKSSRHDKAEARQESERCWCSVEDETCEVLDEIDEAWEEAMVHGGSLSLRHLRLNSRTMKHLISKHQQKKSLFPNNVLIRKIALYRCLLNSRNAAALLVAFLRDLGNKLEEIYITECLRCSTQRRRKAISCSAMALHALHHEYASSGDLVCIDIHGADLRGKECGIHLQQIMAKNPKLEVLQLYKCTVDDAMIHELCIALQYYSSSLQLLDFGGWQNKVLDDLRMERIVHAMVSSCTSCSNLQSFDISESSITEYSLQNLTRVLSHCPNLRELIIYDCYNLVDTVTPGSPHLATFSNALMEQSHSSKIPLLQSDSISSCGGDASSSCVIEHCVSTTARTHLSLGYETCTAPLVEALVEANPCLRIETNENEPGSATREITAAPTMSSAASSSSTTAPLDRDEFQSSSVLLWWL